jgi:hypothetical protein
MKIRTVGLGLLLVAVSAPAFAVPIINATRVRITNANNTWLQIAELQAVTFGNVNVAAAANGGVATGSIPGYDSYATPDKAIDGNTGGHYYTDKIFHPSTEGGTYFEVAFGASDLASLKIFGRTDCCSDRDIYNYSIFNASNVLLGSGTLDATGPTHSATVNFNVIGAVPEPATWAMMTLGFGIVGGALRSSRRRTRVTFATA